MVAAVDVQKIVGLGHAQLGKEHVGHIGIKVLAGVRQHLCQTRRGGNGMADHAGFDELRARTQHSKDFVHASLS